MKTNCQTNTVFHGIGISNGKAGGPLRFWKKPTETPTAISKASPPRSPNTEKERLKKALENAKSEIEQLHRRAAEELGKEEAHIFEIHAMLLEDEDFTESLDHELNLKNSAEDAVRITAQKYEQLLGELNDAYLAARAADIRDISSRLLRILSGKENFNSFH